MWSNDGYAEQPNPEAGGGYPGPGSPVAVAPNLGAPALGTQVAVMAPHAASAPVLPAPALAPPSSTALGGASDIPASLMERIELCKFLAGANLLPSALRGSPANVLLIMHKAMALQIPLAVAIEHLYVIDGKVGHSAELLRALLYRHGHVLRWPTSTDKEVVGELVLRHDPKNPRRAKFTMIDASRMELTNKKNWKLDPESMLVARCTTRLVSRHCPEVGVALGNLSAVDFEDIDAEPVKATAEVDDRPAQAADLYADARDVSTVDDLKAIGTRAKELGLLEVPVVGDTTLQQALLQRIDEISKARRKTGEPVDKDKPQAKRAAGGEE